MSQKASYDFKKIDPVINGFNPHEVRNHLNIYTHSVVKFGIRGLCLGLSIISLVESLYRFRKSVFDKVIIEFFFQ